MKNENDDRTNLPRTLKIIFATYIAIFCIALLLNLPAEKILAAKFGTSVLFIGLLALFISLATIMQNGSSKRIARYRMVDNDKRYEDWKKNKHVGENLFLPILAGAILAALSGYLIIIFG